MGDKLCGPDRTRQWCTGVLASKGPLTTCIHFKAAGLGKAITRETPESKCMQPRKPAFCVTPSTCQQHGSLSRCSWLHWAARRLASSTCTHSLQTTMALLHTWHSQGPNCTPCSLHWSRHLTLGDMYASKGACKRSDIHSKAELF